jgi:hypothetical protein
LKLCINDTKLEIELKNTNFVDYYVDRIFHKSVQQELTSPNLYEDYQTWKMHRNSLLDILVATNKVVDQGLVDEGWRFDVPDTVAGVDIKYLEYVHEHWADYTSRFKKIQAQGNTQDPFEKQMVVMDMRLQQAGFSGFHEINHCVHLVEHMHMQMFSHFFIANTLQYDYQVQAEDTVFYPSQLNIPYHNIGRPQYEKWLLSGSVTNTEIENFTNIPNAIELHMMSNKLVKNCQPEQEYVDACNSAGVDVWGNYLPLGNLKDNYFYSGYKIFNAFFDDEKNNKIYVEK